ncbi:MAG: ATP-binding protein [Gammaproteobacteria bacterium]
MSEQSHKVDLVVHVDDSLGSQRRQDIESALESSQGVRWAHFTDGRPHLMVVEYDPDDTTSLEILECVNRQSVHAELVGPI